MNDDVSDMIYEAQCLRLQEMIRNELREHGHGYYAIAELVDDLGTDEPCVQYAYGMFRAQMFYCAKGESFFFEPPSFLVTNTSPCMNGQWGDAEEAMSILFDVADKLDIALRGWPYSNLEWLRRFPFLAKTRAAEQLVYIPGSREKEN